MFLPFGGFFVVCFGPSITKNLHAIIVNGDNINLWDDAWIEGTVLSGSALEVRWESSALFDNLRDFISDGAWNTRRLEGILGSGVALMATSVPISSDLQQDFLVWELHAAGHFCRDKTILLVEDGFFRVKT